MINPLGIRLKNMLRHYDHHRMESLTWINGYLTVNDTRGSGGAEGGKCAAVVILYQDSDPTLFK